MHYTYQIYLLLFIIILQRKYDFLSHISRFTKNIRDVMKKSNLDIF